MPAARSRLGNARRFWANCSSIPSISMMALVQAFTYVILALFFSISGAGGHIILRQLLLWPALLTLTFCYCRSGRIVRSERSASARSIVAFAAVFAMLALLIPPFHSTDLYAYVGYGWMQSHYNLNPYVDLVAAIPSWPSDPMWAVTPIEFADSPCAYGFLFALLARFLGYLGRGNLLLSVMLFKITNLATMAAIGWLVLLCARRLGVPSSPSLCLLLWNPLILLQHIANGHNDVLAGFFTILAIYLALARLWILVIPAIVAGALIKYPCAVAIPFAVAFVIRRAGLMVAIIGIGAGVLVSLACAWPYSPELSRFPIHAIVANLTATANSLESVLFYLYEMFTKLLPSLRATLATANEVFKATIWLGCAVLLIFQMLRFIRVPNPSVTAFITVILYAQLLVIVVASSKFYPWYIGMFFPLAMLLPGRHWLSRLALAISLGELFAFTFVGQVHILNYLLMIALPAALIIADPSTNHARQEYGYAEHQSTRIALDFDRTTTDSQSYRDR
jgi:alpha-1,6-mannosyltransferase